MVFGSGRLEKVKDAWESCCLWWEKVKDARWWGLSMRGNCILSWVRIFLQVMLLSVFQYQMKWKMWGVYCYKMTINLVLKKLYCSSVLHCWRWCWIITESEFTVAAASFLKPCCTVYNCGYRMKKGFSLLQEEC